MGGSELSKELLNYIGFDLSNIPSELVAEKPKLTKFAISPA